MTSSPTGLEEAISQSGRYNTWCKAAAVAHLAAIMVPSESVFRAEEPLGMKINGIFVRGLTGFVVTSHRAVALGLSTFRSRVTNHIDLPLSEAQEWESYTVPIGGTPAWGIETAYSAETVDVFFDKKEQLDRAAAALHLALVTKPWAATR
jgi:hypothetical protein